MSHNNAKTGLYCGMVGVGVTLLLGALQPPKQHIAVQRAESALNDGDAFVPSLLSFLVTHDLFPGSRSKSFDWNLYKRLSKFLLRENSVGDENLACIGIHVVAGIHGDMDATNLYRIPNGVLPRQQETVPYFEDDDSAGSELSDIGAIVVLTEIGIEESAAQTVSVVGFFVDVRRQATNAEVKKVLTLTSQYRWIDSQWKKVGKDKQGKKERPGSEPKRKARTEGKRDE